jgi:hypothetical protein
MNKKVSSARIILLLIIFAVNFSACLKEGPGGKSSISGAVMHHEIIIPNSTVYIKYNATEFPGTDLSKYDASTTADASAHYEFKGLRKGDYYLYGVGFDNMIADEVTGGIHVKIKYNTDSEADVPVTEP